MEELEEIMDSFDQLPAFRCTMDAKTAVKGAGGFRGHEKGNKCKGGGLICLL